MKLFGTKRRHQFTQDVRNAETFYAGQNSGCDRTSRITPRNPDLVYPSDYRTDDDDSLFFISLVVAVVIAVVVIIIVVPFVNNDDHPQDTGDVVQDLDQYGGTVYLDEATGGYTISLKPWYIPREADVEVAGDYIYVNGAKSYPSEVATHEIYIHRQSIEYIEINNH